MKAKLPLIAIFFVALIVRAVCVAIFYGEIDTEGSEYAQTHRISRWGTAIRE
jgi:hypothetical protein